MPFAQIAGSPLLPDIRPIERFYRDLEDPRTEPGELDRIAREVPSATNHRIAGGRHAPHSQRGASAEATAVAARFLRAR